MKKCKDFGFSNICFLCKQDSDNACLLDTMYNAVRIAESKDEVICVFDIIYQEVPDYVVAEFTEILNFVLDNYYPQYKKLYENYKLLR